MNKVDTEVVKFILATAPSSSNAEVAKRALVSEEDVAALRASLGLASPKRGTETLKQYAARYLLEMTESEKKEFIKKLPEEMIWKMAEGSPATTGTLDLINTEPIRIDISHQLLQVYGQPSTDELPTESERRQLPAGPSK